MISTQQLQTLFDVELQLVKGKQRVLSEPGRVGEYLGSGEGMIRGEQLNGRVHSVCSYKRLIEPGEKFLKESFWASLLR